MRRLLAAVCLLTALGSVAVAAPMRQRTRQVKVYLVALDDKGKRGRRIGCDDSLVPVTHTVAASARQFRGVRSVRVFLNGQRLADAIR